VEKREREVRGKRGKKKKKGGTPTCFTLPFFGKKGGEKKRTRNHRKKKKKKGKATKTCKKKRTLLSRARARGREWGKGRGEKKKGRKERHGSLFRPPSSMLPCVYGGGRGNYHERVRGGEKREKRGRKKRGPS